MNKKEKIKTFIVMALRDLGVLSDRIIDLNLITLDKLREIANNDESIIDYLYSLCDNSQDTLLYNGQMRFEEELFDNYTKKEVADLLISNILLLHHNAFGINNGLSCAILAFIDKIDKENDLLELIETN